MEQLEVRDRIRELRTKEGLSRLDFGEKIGKTSDAVYNLEKGRARISKEVISLICKIFRVNENWILSGEGEMYAMKSDFKLGEAFDNIIDSEELTEIVCDLISLNDEKISIIRNLVRVLKTND